MAINADKAFDIDKDGLVICGDDGINLLYIAGGSGSPVGTQAPVPTQYVEDNGTIWIKYGPTALEWRKIEKPNFPFTAADCGIFKTSEVYQARNASGINLSSTPQTLNISQLDPGTDTIAFSGASGEVILQNPGDFYASFQISTLIGGSDTSCLYFFEINTGSGFTTVPGSVISQSSNIIALFGTQSPAREILLEDVPAGSILRVRGQIFEGAGTANIFGQQSVFSIRPKVSESQEPFLALDCGVYEGEEEECIVKIDCGVE